MTLTTAGAAHHNSEINVLPMIDILLVLVIIFMALVTLRMAMEVQVPPPSGDEQAGPGSSDVVLELPDAGDFLLHGEVLTADGLMARLREVFDVRPRKVLLVKAGGLRTYGEVIAAMDVAREAGVQVVGLAP